MGRGIPPSLDRQDALRRQALLVSAVVLVGCGTLYLLFGGGKLSHDTLKALQTVTEDTRSSSPDEVGLAYRAVQGFVASRVAQRGGTPTQWSTPRHEGRDGWYRFEGEVTVDSGGEAVRVLTYEAVVILRGKGQWTLDTLALQ